MSVLFLIISSHRKKREAKIKRDVKRGIREPNEQNPFEIFVTVTDIRYWRVNVCGDLNPYSPSTHPAIIKSLKIFSEIRMACVFCKILRPLLQIYLRER